MKLTKLTKTDIFAALILAFNIAISGCASRSVAVSSAVPYDLDIQPLGKFDGVPEKVGSSPVSIDYNKLEGKMLRVSKSGKTLQHWVFPKDSGGSIELQLADDLEEKISAADTSINAASQKTTESIDVNLVPRLLLQSYQALTDKDYALARSLAEQASTLSAQIAAPQILVGLSWLQEGNKPNAKAAFAKAKGLDPSDKNLDELLIIAE